MFEEGKEGGALIFNLAQLVFMLNHALSSHHRKDMHKRGENLFVKAGEGSKQVRY